MLGSADPHFHFIVRFTPKPGKADAFRELILETNIESRKEDACLGVDIFESIHEPKEFSIHSIWADEAAFEFHAIQPHAERLIAAARELLTHEIKGLRLMKIG